MCGVPIENIKPDDSTNPVNDSSSSQWKCGCGLSLMNVVEKSMSSLLKTNPNSASDDLIERGQAAYRERLRSILEPSHDGEFVAVEPDSGRYFLGSTASAALVTAHDAMPNNLFYLTRVGRETAH